MPCFVNHTFCRLLAATVWLFPCLAYAAPFDACPTEAFLIQDNVARIYGVNLATGRYEEQSNAMGTSGKINAIGFNYHDSYLYGFGYEFGNVVQIGADLLATPLNVTGLPSTSFFVGDVALSENSYFLYRRGSSYGLYKVSLDTASPNYLQAEKIINGASLDLRIFDFAFHPQNGALYSVDASGYLIRIDAQTGQSTVVSNVGEQGTFGAVYFDVDHQLYISRNSDGHIFRIDVDQATPIAEFFAFGPASSNNDGARCALAPIISEASTVDFGDAPDSYGTTIESNGARHEISPDLYLGENSGGEDDGVTFVTGFETGLDSLVGVEAVGEGLLSMWVDWDQSGAFDSDEQVVTDKALQDGANLILIAVPDDAKTGNTWSRTRYSSTPGIGPVGGVADGEVEDNVVTVTPSGVHVVSYPSSNTVVTLAFEDNWPQLGDYDFNDVVMAYRTKQYINDEQQVVRYDIEGYVLAATAGDHNGFAVQLDGIATANVAENLMRFEVNGEQVQVSPLEANLAGDDAVVVPFNDINVALASCADPCQLPHPLSFIISVPLIDPVDVSVAPHSTLNPFIFASPGYYHGDIFSAPPGRGLEVHLKNKKASARFNASFLNTYDDDSNSAEQTRFLTRNNLPWALEIPILWSHPREHVDISDAYPDFPEYVRSSGANNATWYLRSQAVDALIVNNE